MSGQMLPNTVPVIAPSFQRELNNGVVTPMTEELAVVFAKLLKVGCPPVRAVLYCVPVLAETEAGKDEAKKIAFQWTHDALVLDALANINGGKFHEMELERRMQLALDKNDAEACFFLWSFNFGEAFSTEDLNKMKLARDIAKARLGQQPDDKDPTQAFARFALDFAREAMAQKAANAKLPPEVGKSGLDKLLETTPKELLQ